jgi:hypothetical protein
MLKKQIKINAFIIITASIILSLINEILCSNSNILSLDKTQSKTKKNNLITSQFKVLNETSTKKASTEGTLNSTEKFNNSNDKSNSAILLNKNSNITTNSTVVNNTEIDKKSDIDLKKNVSLIKIHEFNYQFREYVYCGKDNEIILAITEDNKLMRTKDKGFNWALVTLPAEQTTLIKKIYE